MPALGRPLSRRERRISSRNQRMRIALFVTCIGDTLYPSTGRAVVGILERLGHEVVFPAAQTCCGQMHLNSGYRPEAAKLARRFSEVFASYDLIVAPSSSCVGMVREFHPQLVPDAAEPRGRVFELTELLVERLGIEELGASFPRRVTYHPTCHSLRVARIGDAPYRLLRAVDGLELVELPDGEECCGFGGTFAVKNADSSIAILEDKCRAIAATGAEICTAVDPSCLLQIDGGLSRRPGRARTLHIAEILASEGAA
jgi:L-lactate dehydrogenase complex protein LldE